MTLWLLLACAPEPAPTTPAPAPAPVAPVAEAPVPVPAQPATDPVARLAVVKEVLQTDRYTFFRMDACGTEAWVAGPPTQGVAEGDVLAMPEGMAMTNFESATLKRTFDVILFVDWVATSDDQPQCAPEVKATENQRIGVVLEVSEAGGYHYAKLDNCGETWWLAAQGPAIQVGTTLLTEKGSVMADFTSPSTGQVFDEIVFVGRYQPVRGVPFCEGEAPK
jgi:hypothetical protein